jgi:WXXGXW repeat (2 copies)
LKERIMKSTPVIRQLMLAALLACGGAAFAQVSFSIQIGPPMPIYETVPIMAPGYVWAPGYWAWHEDRHVWIRGRSIVHRTGYRWQPDVWEQRDNRYYRHPGKWEHDPGYHAPRAQGGKNPGHWDNRDHNGGKPRKGSKHDG